MFTVLATVTLAHLMLGLHL